MLVTSVCFLGLDQTLQLFDLLAVLLSLHAELLASQELTPGRGGLFLLNGNRSDYIKDRIHPLLPSLAG